METRHSYLVSMYHLKIRYEGYGQNTEGKVEGLLQKVQAEGFLSTGVLDR